jgi:hypothetical protein
MTEQKREEIQALVKEIEHVCGNPTPQVYCAILTVAVNLIHVVEDDGERKRIEQAFIVALQFLSAIEEVFQPRTAGEEADPVRQLTEQMLHHVCKSAGW